MDACHSGDTEKNGIENFITTSISANKDIKGPIVISNENNEKQSEFELMLNIFSELSPNIGARVIAASVGQEYAQESQKWQNGAFTYSILKSLKDNCQLSVQGLFEQVKKEVNVMTKGIQTPTLRRINVKNDFIIVE